MKKIPFYVLLFLTAAAGCKKDDDNDAAYTSLFRENLYTGDVHYVRVSSIQGQPKDTLVPGLLTLHKVNGNTLVATLNCTFATMTDTLLYNTQTSVFEVRDNGGGWHARNITVTPAKDTATYTADEHIAASTNDHYTMKFIR